ncbi:VOC family protein [Lapillicoccus sp.]|uniref:VOC family protein n=1 Tax=Lapillicoccus sp. TaxID=1909287 RepID=UPI0025E73827|nr:VOC family protein [Lapillicoccus sp.]
MKITACAVSLNVDDVPASAAFLPDHFGFQEQMAADGFASLAREDAGMDVIFLRRGLPTLPEDQRHDHTQGLILALTVDNLDEELARLEAEGVNSQAQVPAGGHVKVPTPCGVSQVVGRPPVRVLASRMR